VGPATITRTSTARKKLADGYRKTISNVGLQAYMRASRREWRFDVLSEGNPTTATGPPSTSISGALLFAMVNRADGAALLVGRAVDDFGQHTES